MKRIKLYGYLAEKYGSEFKLSVNSAPEAVRAISFGMPGFSEDIKGGKFHVWVGNEGHELYLDEETVNLHTDQDIHIMPVIEGSRGELKTIIGIVLLVAAFVLTGPMGSMAAIGAPVALSAIQTAMYYIGFTMLASGVMQMLSPGATKGTNQNNGVFGNESGIANQGQAIPLLYGEMYCDLAPISAAIENEVHDVNSADAVYLAAMGAIASYWITDGNLQI